MTKSKKRAKIWKVKENGFTRSYPGWGKEITDHSIREGCEERRIGIRCHNLSRVS